MDLKSLRKEILASVLIFFIGMIYGYLSAIYFPEILQYFELLREILKPVAEASKTELMIYILLNNSFKTFLAVISGFFLAIFPILFLFSNGFILGMLYEITRESIGPQGFLIAILPHGILEIPALLISGALGIRLGYSFIQFLRRKADFKRELADSLRIYFKFILPLLIIAAFIETFITMSLVGK
jgi:stage II sporulation protein M